MRNPKQRRRRDHEWVQLSSTLLAAVAVFVAFMINRNGTLRAAAAVAWLPAVVAAWYLSSPTGARCFRRFLRRSLR